MDIVNEIKKGNYKAINSDNISEIAKHIEKLEEYAECGMAYREQLEKDYIRYGALCFKDSNNLMTSTAKKLSVKELEESIRLYKNAVNGNTVFSPQLILNNNSNSKEFYNKQEYSI